MGTLYPRSDHYPPHPEISNKYFYFAVVCYTGGNSPGKLWMGPIVFFKKFRKPYFGPNIWPPEGQNEARNTKMHRGQETHPIRYEMNWANSFFKKFWKPCLSTDGRTDGRTDGWTDIGVNPVYPYSTFGGAGGIKSPTQHCKSLHMAFFL